MPTEIFVSEKNLLAANLLIPKKTLGQKKLKKAEKADATHATSIFKDTVPSCLFFIVHATEKG